MKITELEISETGGFECVVTEVLNCPVHLFGSITTYPHDEPSLEVHEALLILDDDGLETEMWRLSILQGKLATANFQEIFFAQAKEEI